MFPAMVGPLLFSLYINDMPLVLENAKCNLYADDSALSLYGHTVDEVIQQLHHELELVAQWFNLNKLCQFQKKNVYAIWYKDKIMHA